MIRRAQMSDIPRLYELWQECFNEDGKEREFFFSRLFRAANSLVFCEDKVCAMLHVLPYDLNCNGKCYPVHYFYGIGTAESARGRGYAAKLLDAAILDAKLCGAPFCFLVPQSESLFDYYKRFGFEPSVLRTLPNFTPLGFKKAIYSDIPRLNEIYENALKDRVHLTRTPYEWRVILDEGYRILLGEQAYAVYAGERMLEAFGGATECESVTPYAAFLKLDDNFPLDGGYFNLLHD